MIYKFIDNSDQEITVNSLSSLQALVDSETIKKNTKIKAGLRGKWVKAESVEDLNFEEKKVEEPPKEETEDIVDIITREPEPTPPPKVNSGSPTMKVMTINGDLQPVARIGDTLSCGCMIMGGGNTVGGGANG